MKKLFLALLFALVAAGAANAQRRSTVSGVVADADTHQGIIGVVVELIPVSDSTKSAFMISGAGGAFSTGLGREQHQVRASIIGYETLHRTVDITEARQTLDTLYLRQGIQIDAVVKEVVRMRTSMSGDTLIYNADSYKVAADANVSGLLEKMPGIKVEGGTVEAQGEAVRKILIDGREFFGEDVSAAISSLPAEAVKQLEVFDKLSDNAEFTGIDDGEGYKAINIVTRESMRQGIIGQVSALYGAEPSENSSDKWSHYGLAGGNVNIFNGDAKITVGGTINNLNERHFTSQDILGAGDDDGIAKVGRLQLNYIDMLGKNNQWNIDASYSYNATDAESYSIIDREYYASGNPIYSNYSSVTRRNTFNQGHNLNARIDFKPNSYHELRIRPMVRYQGNRSDRISDEIYFPSNGSDNIIFNNWSNSDESGYMVGLNTNYRVRLGKPGRTLSLFFNTMYDPDDHNGESYSEREELDENGNHISVRQTTPSYNYDFRIGGGLTYTEPVSSNSLINLEYNVNYSYSDQDRKAYLWNDILGRYSDEPDNDLSGVYNSGYITHRMGPGYRMIQGKNTLSLSVSYQYSTLESSRVLPQKHDLNKDFNNITYSALLDTQFPSGASIRVMLNSRTQNPSVFDLTDVADISNVQNISRGNLDLKPSYNNMLMGRFIIPNVDRGRTLAINLGGRYTNNAIVRRAISESPGYQIISNGEVIETLDGMGRYSEPVNMDGQWDARLGITYGFPVSFLRSNLNLDAGLTYSESPSQLGKWNGGSADNVTWTTNYSRILSPRAGIIIGSNISEKIDFRVGYNIEYNRVRNTAFVQSNSEFLKHNFNTSFKFVLPANFTLAGNLSYYKYNPLSGQNFDQEYFIANAAVGKKVLRSRLGEVSIFVNDIFNQNVGFRRRPEALYIQNQIDSVIGRYVGVKFTWNIRKFGKNGSQNIDMYQTEGGEGSHGHGAGMPTGGGGGRGFGGGGGFGGGRPF